MAPEATAREYQRFTRLNRILHIVMIVSFMSLALTGMTLKFSYTGWASFLSRLFGGFESAGYIHRFAAVVMFGIFVAHIVDLLRRVRRESGGLWKMLTGPDTMLPTKKDWRDLKDRCGGSSAADRARSTDAGRTGRSSTTSPCSGGSS